MKSPTLFLLLAATLTCRAETSSAKPADHADAAKPAQAAAAPATPAKPADPVAPAAQATEASKAPAAQKSESTSTMAPVVVKATSDLKPTMADLKMDLADTLSGQMSISQDLADNTRNQKVALARLLAIDQPVLGAPKLPVGGAPMAGLSPVVDPKTLRADASK